MRRWLAALAAVSFICLSLAQTNSAPTGQLTKEQFDKLPPTHVLTINGKRMTKAEFLAIVAKIRTEAARVRPVPSLDQLQAAVAQKQRASIAARNRLAVQKATAAIKATLANQVALKPTLSAPHITDVHEAPVSPGSTLIIRGSGFGEGVPKTNQGGGGGVSISSDPCWYVHPSPPASPPPGAEARLYGAFPGGYVKLRINNWQPECINADVPTVVGVLAQQAEVKVASGGLSNGFPVAFEPREICKLIEAQLFRCNHPVGPGGSDPECSMELGDSPRLNARHIGRELGEMWWVEGSDGIEVALPLKNGWKLQRAWVGQVECIGSVMSCAANLRSFEIGAGATTGRATFDWSFAGFPSDLGVHYTGMMEAHGPAGTPYK